MNKALLDAIPGLKNLTPDEQKALGEYLKEEAWENEPFTLPTVDEIFTSIDGMRARIDAIMSYLLPYFDQAEPSTKDMIRIQWDYERIRVFLETILDSNNDIERQCKRWGRIARKEQEVQGRNYTPASGPDGEGGANNGSNQL